MELNKVVAKDCTERGERAVELAAYISDAPREFLWAGWLLKLGRRVKSWKRRWFVLTASGLSYYAAVNGAKTKSKGAIEVRIGRLVGFGFGAC